MLIRSIVFITSAIILSAFPLNAQENEIPIQENAIKVFLDRFSNEDHIKREIPYINYVRDTREAQVYILLTTQATGGGGSENTMTFVGQEKYTGVNDTLSFVSIQSETQDEIRDRMIESLKLGLIRYVSKTPFAKNITINYTPETENQGALLDEDKWDYWVFRLSLNSFLSGEESFKNTNLSGSASANRITENWKIQIGYNSNYSESRFDTDSGSIFNFTRNHNFNSLFVKSLSDHWSTGFSGNVSSSTFTNTKIAFTIAPAMEYNYFSYDESTRRRLSFLYKINLRNVNYREETIFNKTSESLFNTSLSVNTSFIEKWGTISSSLEGIVFFHDPEINRLNWNGNFNLRIAKGLSLNMFGIISLTHDQLFLPKGNRSLEEVLLRRTQLKSNWNYFTSFGFSYSFGSIYNNIVNPRFAGGGGGSFIIF